MKKLLVALAALLCCASTAQASTITWNLTLSGLNESPAVITPATGAARVVFDDVADTLTLDISFSGLLGLSTASHIHCCEATPGVGNVGVATVVPAFPGFPIGVTSGSVVGSVLDLNSASAYNPAFVTAQGSVAAAESAFIAGLVSGRTYLNIHSMANPGGELRAQITAVPEPTTISLLGLGGLIALRRRQARH